ncbi:MAG: exopolysaccharide biosynthesis protein [Rhizobiales bacterium]|nr:exopolysaccharide biosynthesis protein [Hyphomicrobiales bacterium]
MQTTDGHALRIHEILAGLLKGEAGSAVLGEQPAVDDIILALGPRSFGMVLVMFGLPNLLPVPGLPILCGFIIGIIAFQMVLGKDHLVLPRWVGSKRVKREDLSRVVQRATPTLSAIERAMRPRIAVLTDPPMQRVLGVILCILALALMAPIPFFGGIAPGIAVILLGLGLAERDGVVVLLGGLASVFAVIVTLLVTLAIVKSLVFLVA